MTNEEVRRKIRAAIGEYDELLTPVKMVWSRFNVFWFSKDNPTGHSERTKEKRQTEEEVLRQYQRVDRNGLCQLNYRAAENRTRWKGIVPKSSAVPRRPSKAMGWNRIEKRQETVMGVLARLKKRFAPILGKKPDF